MDAVSLIELTTHQVPIFMCSLEATTGVEKSLIVFAARNDIVFQPMQTNCVVQSKVWNPSRRAFPSM